MFEKQTGVTRIRSVVVALALAFALTSCGSGESDRDQALSALDRATQAAGLETEMASLVADIPDDPNPTQGENINASVKVIDSQAETILASTDTGKAYDQKITEAVNETRGAGNEITTSVNDPAKLKKARAKAVGRLTGSNENLSQATTLIGTDLADEEGNLTAEDADAIEQTLVAVDDSGQAVVEAGEEAIPKTDCPVDDNAYPNAGLTVRQVSCGEGLRVAEEAIDRICSKVCDKVNINDPARQYIESKTSFDGWKCTGGIHYEGRSAECVDGLRFSSLGYGI